MSYIDILNKHDEMDARNQPVQNEDRKGTPKTYQTYTAAQKPQPLPRPDYLAITRNNVVPPTVIESLGGVQDTIAPIQASLKRNELRPFEYVRRPTSNKSSDKGPKILSASPYRAHVEVPMSNEVEARFEQIDVSPIETYKKHRMSPIKDDSVLLREHYQNMLPDLGQNLSEIAPAHPSTHQMSLLQSEPGQHLQQMLGRSNKYGDGVQSHEFQVDDECDPDEEEQQEPYFPEDEVPTYRRETSDYRQQFIALRKERELQLQRLSR